MLRRTDEEPTDHIEHRGLKETEAEGVAYIVSGLMGLDTSAYSIGYIAGWSACEIDTVKTAASRVLRTLQTLVAVITDDLDSTS